MALNASDPYATLGIARGASEKDIKSAYRALAKELHPDRNKDSATAAERFSKVTQAYDLLSDKDKRARYDRGEIDGDGNPANPFAGMGGGFNGGGFGGRSGGVRPEDLHGQNPFGGGAEGVDLGDLFEGLFGGNARARTGGPGGGFGSGGFGGQHRPPPPQKGADIAYRLRVPFAAAATLAPQRITLADGKTIDLKLPEGVESGTQMRLKGKGQAGPGGSGDGIVTIDIEPHRLFRRDGDDVRCDVPITLDEAVAGGKLRIPTVDGAVMMTVKPGTSGGTVLRLKGKGFTRKSGGGERGDQLVTLEIQLPADLDELTRRLEGWRDDTEPRAALGV